jgi:hypothetical protein
MAALFIDESKNPRYFLAATVIQEADVPRLRKLIRAEVRKGQRAIHFSKEEDSRRRELLSIFTRAGFQSHLFTSKETKDLDARFECFEKLVTVALTQGETRLVLERDDSVFKFDEKTLSSLINECDAKGKVGFEHMYRHEEPLLWVADAIVWCANRGGEWLHRSAGLIIKSPS